MEIGPAACIIWQEHVQETWLSYVIQCQGMSQWTSTFHVFQQEMLCSDIRVKGGRQEIMFYCKNCTQKPCLHPGECFSVLWKTIFCMNVCV